MHVLAFAWLDPIFKGEEDLALPFYQFCSRLVVAFDEATVGHIMPVLWDRHDVSVLLKSTKRSKEGQGPFYRGVRKERIDWIIFLLFYSYSACHTTQVD